MRCAILVFCAGIVSAVFATDVPLSLSIILGFTLLVGALLFLTVMLGSHRHVQRSLALLVIFLLGLDWHLLWASAGLGERLPRELEGVTFEVEGVVVGLPERSPIAQQFQFQILRSPSGFHPRKVTLSYYGDTPIVTGQYWRLAVRLNRPHGFANPGGIDYEAWLFQQGISARGYVRESGRNELLLARQRPEYFVPEVWIHSLRYSLRVRLQRLSDELPYAGLLTALVLGDRSAISQDDWNLFGVTGSNHLFVISGLHIGLVSGFCYYLSLLLGRGLRIGRVVPAQKIAALCALAAAFSYALLAGFTLPTQRAFIMIAVLICGLFWYTRYLISFRLLFALWVVLLINPLAFTSSGFWLSFIAVAALLSFADTTPLIPHGEEFVPSLRTRLGYITSNYVKPQIIVLVALAIPLIVFTGQLSLLAPIVNIVAIPVVGFLIVPLCFAALLLSYMHEAAAAILLGAAHGSIASLIRFMEILSEWGKDSLQLQFAQAGAMQLLAMFLAAALLLLPKCVCRTTLIFPLLLPLFPLPASIASPIEANRFLRFHIMDVGQGLAVVVQTERHVLLYDSGAKLSPDFNMGSAVIVPALRAWGISRLDAVVISHGDNDHAGGLTGILQHMEVDTLIANDPHIDANREADLCDSVADWNWDGVGFRFLRSGVSFADENNSSCVLQVRFAGAGLLLPGDIERDAETALVLRYGAELKTTVMLAPHHGSLSSSSYGLLKNVRPDYVVFSAGYHNSFGHPHGKIESRFREFASRALTTSEVGMISFHFGAGEARAAASVSPDLYRERNFRYWR